MINFGAVTGTKMYTRRYDAVDTDGIAVGFSDKNINGYFVHFEGSTVVGHIDGSSTSTNSSTAYITSDGTTVSFAHVVYAGKTGPTIKAPAGTIKISVIAFGD